MLTPGATRAGQENVRYAQPLTDAILTNDNRQSSGLLKRLVFSLVCLAVTALQAVPVSGAGLEELTVRPLTPEYRIHSDGAVSLRICFNWSCFTRETVIFVPGELAAVSRQMSTCPGDSLHDRVQRVRIGIWQMEELAKKYLPVLANDQAINDRDAELEGRTDCDELPARPVGTRLAGRLVCLRTRGPRAV